jgi:Flp pilus assembly CpaF family ATPase
MESGLFEGEEAVLHLIERIVGPLGLRVDESSPFVDARLPDGSRIHAIIPPLSLCGPVITVRKFGIAPIGPPDLVRLGTATQELMAFLGDRVRDRSNLLVSGGASSGKTTLLGVLSSFIPKDERIITIEDAGSRLIVAESEEESDSSSVRPWGAVPHLSRERPGNCRNPWVPMGKGPGPQVR